MTTNPEIGSAQSPTVVTSAAAHTPFAGEVAERLRAIGELTRRLAEERAALADLLTAAHAAAPIAQVESSSAEGGDNGSAAGRFAVVTDSNVAAGERRLAAAGDVSPNTRRTYESALRGLDAWLCERHEGRAANDALLAEYLAVLAAQRRGVSSAVQAVAAAKWRSKRHGGECPVGEKTMQALRRYRRAADAAPGQVRGISWEEADRMRDLAARVGDARGLRDAALIAVASDALLRVSELSSVQVRDVAFEGDGSARLLVRRSKNDRQGRGALLFPGRRTAQLVRQWMAVAKVETGALFRRMHRAGSIAAEGMGIGSVRRVIVRRAKAAGVSGRVSGHSLRVGSAQSLARRGAGLVAMQKAGRWVSPDMPARYTRSQAAAEGAVARLRHRHEQSARAG